VPARGWPARSGEDGEGAFTIRCDRRARGCSPWHNCCAGSRSRAGTAHPQASAPRRCWVVRGTNKSTVASPASDKRIRLDHHHGRTFPTSAPIRVEARPPRSRRAIIAAPEIVLWYRHRHLRDLSSARSRLVSRPAGSRRAAAQGLRRRPLGRRAHPAGLRAAFQAVSLPTREESLPGLSDQLGAGWPLRLASWAGAFAPSPSGSL